MTYMEPTLKAIKSQVRLFDIENKQLTPNILRAQQQVAFFIFSLIDDLNIINEYLKQLGPEITNMFQIWLILSPQSNPLIQTAIEEAPFNYQTIYVNYSIFFQDIDIINYHPKFLTQSLCTIVENYGIPDEVTFFGPEAQKEAENLYQKIFFMRKNGTKIHSTTDIRKIIIIDRQLDLPSLLSTGITYESLLRELCQNEYSCYKITKDGKIVTKNKDQQIINKDLILNMFLTLSDDPVYSKINCLPLQKVPEELNKITTELKEFYQNNKNLKEQTLAQVKQVGRNVKFYKLLEEKLNLHLTILQQILEWTDSDFYASFDLEQEIIKGSKGKEIEDQIISYMQLLQVPSTSLRLCVLYCLYQQGLSQTFYKGFCKLFLQIYGFQYYTVLSELLNKHLLYPYGFNGQKSTNYQNLRKMLAIDSFTPISCKLIELLCYQDTYMSIKQCKAQDRNMQSYLSKLMGSEQNYLSVEKCFEQTNCQENTFTFKELQYKNQRASSKKQTILVVFLEKISQNEVSWCRMLNNKKNEEKKIQFGDKYQIQIMCEAVKTGTEYIEELIENNQMKQSLLRETGVLLTGGKLEQIEGNDKDRKETRRRRR